MQGKEPEEIIKLEPSRIEVLAISIKTKINRPNRSRILYTALEKDTPKIENCHKERIVWIKDQLRIIAPHLKSSIDSLKWSNLNQAQSSLNDLNNISDDVSDRIMAIKHILTWELQLTADMHLLGILPEEVPGIIANQDLIREENRTFAKKTSEHEYRNTTSLKDKRDHIAEHENSIHEKMIPLVKVLSLKVSTVSSNVLSRFLEKTETLANPLNKKACLQCLKGELIVKARHATSKAEIFNIKELIA